jgi:hypothetical protein
MLLETTYNTKELRKKINAVVGKPLSIVKRLKMGGNGSQRLVVREAFPGLEALLAEDNRPNFCNIEIRESGLILHFRSRLETYAWIVPFHVLSLFKSSEVLSIYGGAEFVKLVPAQNAPLNHKFIQKVLTLKAEKYTQIDEIA